MESKGNQSQEHQQEQQEQRAQKEQQSLERHESNFSINPTSYQNENATITSIAPTLTAAATISSPPTFNSGIVSSSSGSSINQQKTNHRMQQFHSPQPQPSQHFHSTHPKQLQQQNTITTPISGIVERSSSFVSSGSNGSGNTTVGAHQTFEKLSRPAAFDKMESLVREMQDPENGVPVRQQKIFLTSIPYAFMGYDLIEWLMDRLLIEESEALNIANQLCLHGYFFPVNDTKTLVVKDDSSLYRFQTPYYWPWQHKAPDNVEYAIYLAKRSLRNKQRHGLEDYELDALSSLHKNLKGKWDIISMQAEEQVRLAKDRKKGDKIVGDSQERAYWRVHRPPPGQFTPLELCPIPMRDRQGAKVKKKTLEDAQRELDYLKKSINRTRMKMSKACECLVAYAETFAEYDAFLQPPLPSNPWVTEDTTFWQLNSTYVETPTEKRVRRWAISIEELVSDPTGLQEFTNFLEKEYSHENIRFWNEVNCLRRSAHSQVLRKANKIYEEFLMPGAPCEINIDSKTMASVLQALCNPSRFTFDSASEHIYTLLLKKDCYPRFIRSDHYKRLLENGAQPLHKKRFFNFGGVGGARKKMTAALSGPAHSSEATTSKAVTLAAMSVPPQGNLTRRRGSDRSLTGSAHELTVIGVNRDAQANNVPHSHSQSNLSEIPYREASQSKLPARLEPTAESVGNAVCPWDLSDEFPLPTPAVTKSLSSQSTSAERMLGASSKKTRQPLGTSSTTVQLSICPWETNNDTPLQPISDLSSEVAGILERLQRTTLGLRHQNTIDGGETGMKRLIPTLTEQRRASMSFTPSRLADHQLARPTHFKTVSCPSPAVSNQLMESAISSLAPNLGELVSVVSAPIDGTANTLEEEKQLIASSSLLSLSDSCNSHKKVNESVSDNSSGIDDNSQMIPHEPVIEQPIREIEIELIETTDFIDPCQSPQNVREPLAQEAHCSGDQASKSTTPTPTIKVQGHSLQLAVDPCNTNPKSTSSRSSKTTYIFHNSVQENDARKIVDMNSPNVLMAQGYLNTPPPIPPIGPVEEEQLVNAYNDEDDDNDDAVQEDLSPESDEYQEGIQFGKDGYIAPAPTPTPSIAPLAVLDVDTVDDELASEDKEEPLKLLSPSHSAISNHPAKLISIATTSEEDGKRRRKKRNSESKSKLPSLEEKEKITASATAENVNKDTECNAVCPWEDENASTTDGTFVKTYATLGYL